MKIGNGSKFDSMIREINNGLAYYLVHRPVISRLLNIGPEFENNQPIILVTKLNVPKYRTIQD